MPNESILDSIKNLVGVSTDDMSFDSELIALINTIFMELSQMGIGPPIENCFSITDSTETWDQFEPIKKYFQPVKTYIALKVRIIFDPPSNSGITQAFENQINECRDRLRIEVELEEARKHENSG